MQHVVGDAGAAGEEDYGAVAAEVGGRMCGVGSFDETAEFEGEVGSGDGCVVEFARHASAGGHDEGDAGGLVFGGLAACFEVFEFFPLEFWRYALGELVGLFVGGVLWYE